ncbi:caspase family protein [Acinetobacter baumannii]
MKNLAILIGVADYQYLNKLLPCDRDIDLISNILDISGKYQDILLLDHSPISSTVKDQIAEFVRIHQEDEIDEIFIYYTGHGARIKDDFFYLFADFNEQRLEQTSLRNSEFDAMLKSLKPKLTVKVIDACQAGTEYIKSNQELQLIFDKSSKESFNKAYFLFSSSSVENSVALQDFSVFTKSFAKSLLNFEGQNIRYRDVMAYISDDPDVKKHQTPLFIQQADNTEIFLNLTEEISTFINQQIGKAQDLSHADKLKEESGEVLSENGPEQPTAELLLISKIKTKSQSFCSEKEVEDSILNFGNKINEFTWTPLIKELFAIKCDFENQTVNLSSRRDIAKWIFKSQEPYFTEIIYEDEAYEVNQKVEYEENNTYAAIFGRSKRVEYQPVTRYRKVIDSYRITAPRPFQSVIVKLEPTEQILSWYKVFITLIFSKSRLAVFYKYEIEKELNWNDRLIEEKNEWKSLSCGLKNLNEINDLVGNMLQDISQLIEQHIQSSID